ncbi:hypothetical protein MIT9_P1617 [Methylomarinovum caldicuralii]|uniref:HDOD domain-containing protein n=1 Tax=Methylomarinovum caldicuralii TaxID=438856 RepID=A0AAU9C4E4_9GAMM|nr:HDOD domain-containing protein [Methylomarinovum caldicuralii]BCX82035.1 hypothetical protein MIT9_P1617 [Methylomarinovum caldicuralii]
MTQPLSPAQLLEDDRELPSLPDVVVRLRAAIDDPASTADTLAEIIASDPALTARLLKLANSPLYGFGGRIDTISRAVTLVGLEPIYHLALATTAVSVFRGIPAHLIDMDEFWVQSTYCGVVARLLARAAGVLHPERLFVAGLLHGIGSLVLYVKLPDPSREVLLASQGRRELIPLLEKDLLGFTYADVGGEIARRWKLPPWLQTAIAWQLNPEQAGDFGMATGILCLANRLTDVLVHGDAIEDILAEVPAGVRELVPLAEGQILGVMTEVTSEFTEVAAVLLSV